MYPGPNHMRDRHGNNPDLRPDQRMSQNAILESRRDSRLDNVDREKERQEARALREKARNPPHQAAVVQDNKTPAMFTLVRRQQPDNNIAKVLGSFASFSGSEHNLGLMGVEQQPGTPAPATNHHDHNKPRHTDLARQAHRPNRPPTRVNSSAFRPPTVKSPVKLPPRPSPSIELKPPQPPIVRPKPQIVIDDHKLTMIFDEMDDLRTPMSALSETPRRDGHTAFPFPTPPKKDAKTSKTPKKNPSSVQSLEKFHCDLSDDSDVEHGSSTLNGNNGHANGKIRQASSTSQNSDDSSNSEDSSCSDSDDSSSNSSEEEEEEKPAHPEPSQMPSSPAPADSTAGSQWCLEKIFKQQNGNSAKEEVFCEQEMLHKPYDGHYDSLSRSPHRTELAPPIITKEPVGRVRRLTDSSEESALDSSINSVKARETIEKMNKLINDAAKSPVLSESESLEQVPVPKRKAANVPQKTIEYPLYKDVNIKTSKSSSLPSKCSSASKSSREKYNRKSSDSAKVKIGKKTIKSIETIPSDMDTDSDDSKEVVKSSRDDKKSTNKSSLRSSRRACADANGRSSRHSKLTEKSPSVPQDSRYPRLSDMSPPPTQAPRPVSRPTDKESPSKGQSKRGRHQASERVTSDRTSRQSTSENAPSKSSRRPISPAYCPSINLGIQVPKLAVCYGENPSAVLLVPTDLLKPTPPEKASPVKAKINKEVIEMRTSPSNEDSKKLRAICSIFIGSKKRPSSQEPDRNRKSPKVEESQPIKPDVKLDTKKESGCRSSTPQSDVAPSSSSSHRKAAKEDEKPVAEKKAPKETDKRRRRRMSEDADLPKKRTKVETVDVHSSHDRTEHKSRSDRKEGYRSYVKESKSPVQRPSSRIRESSRPSSRNASHNLDVQEFVSAERNSDDDSCFRTPQQVQSYGYKENNSKRQKLEDRQAASKVAPVNSQNTAEASNSASTTQVPPNLSYFSYLEKRLPIVAVDHMQYLLKAKELKHLADKETNRTLQVMIYLESGLYFILTGESMEQETTNVGAAFSMYNDTLKFIRHVSSIIVRKDSFKEDPLHNNLNFKLAVLSLRCQSLLYLKLYTMHAGEANEVQKDLAEYFKAASKSPTVPIAWNPAGQVMAGASGTTSATAIPGRIANSPSSLSPTPSPAGSVGSEGSQSSSGYGTEGASQRAVAGAMSGTPPMVQTSSGHLVPKHTFMSLRRHLSISNFLVAAHHHWKESDTYIYEYNTKDFFIAMDHELGPLTLHSTPSELVIYAQKSLDKLKGQLCLGTNLQSGSSLA